MSRRRGAFSAFEKTASQAVDPPDSRLFRAMFVPRLFRVLRLDSWPHFFL